MLSRANIPGDIRHIVAPMAVRTATKLDSLTLISLDGNVKTRWEHFYGELPTFARSLKIFGEAGTVMLKTATTPKVLNKGVVCMFVEYPDHHGSNCWIMFNPVTRATHTTRDVVWLHRMYYPDPQNLYEVSIPFPDEEEDDDKSLPVGREKVEMIVIMKVMNRSQRMKMIQTIKV